MTTIVDSRDCLPSRLRTAITLSAALITIGMPRLAAQSREPVLDVALARAGDAVRIATFNVALAGDREGQMLSRLADGQDKQARAVARIIQYVDPDVILLNELDFDPNGMLLAIFAERYLNVPQDPVEKHGRDKDSRYLYRFIAAVNTGVASNYDLDHDGLVGAARDTDQYARDAWGYGRYPGQYGMAILSKFPLESGSIRTFRNFRWKDMPGALLPECPTGGPWYSAEILQRFPLSSKSHWDVPILIRGQRVHLLASHPTPPVFDGPEDRNGRRNHDEIRFWADYLSADKSGYIADDAGARGGLADDQRFVILGDLNSDPADGDDPRHPIRRLTGHPRVFAGFTPRSAGGREQASLQSGANSTQRGDPAADTSELPDDKGPGNLRLDYVLPSRGLHVAGGGVFWPERDDARFSLVGSGDPIVSSDHRLAWLDVVVDKALPMPKLRRRARCSGRAPSTRDDSQLRPRLIISASCDTITLGNLGAAREKLESFRDVTQRDP